MKGIYIVIVLSVVWSILAQIIEKKKAAAKKNASLDSSSQLTVQTEWNADPIQIKVESLRRRVRSKSAQAEPPQPIPTKRESKQFESIKPLHVEDCELQPITSKLRNSKSPSKQLAIMLRNNRNIRTAIILSEILSKPIALSNERTRSHLIS